VALIAALGVVGIELARHAPGRGRGIWTASPGARDLRCARASAAAAPL